MNILWILLFMSKSKFNPTMSGGNYKYIISEDEFNEETGYIYKYLNNQKLINKLNNPNLDLYSKLDLLKNINSNSMSQNLFKNLFSNTDFNDFDFLL